MNRIQSRGRWYLKSLPVSSRYYHREPAERAPLKQGEDHNPYDLMIVLKDAHTLQDPEDFVEAILRELSNTGEYSRDRSANDFQANGELSVRRMHANTTAWDILNDFDDIIEELTRLQAELETSNRGNAADRLFSSIGEAYGWNVDELRNSGFHHEIMTYVGFSMMGRLRFMRDYYRKDRNPTDQPTDLLDETSITLSTRWFSAAVHSASMIDDVRMVEWFSNWAVHFPGRHITEFNTSQIDSATAIGLFEVVYKIKYEHAVRLVSYADFANDVDTINSFLSYKGTVEASEPARNNEIVDLFDNWFMPYIRALINVFTTYPENNAEFWRRYRTGNNNIVQLRNRLVNRMDSTKAPTYLGVGRWCRHAPPPGQHEHNGERKRMQEERWTKGWYCVKHRPWLRCTSCGWKYSCVICANPYSCPHCKSSFRCTEESCAVKSDDRPEGTDAQPSYRISVSTNSEGWQQNGRRITPRSARNIFQNMGREARYRQFFPKTVNDIRRDGPIYNKNLSAKFHQPHQVLNGGYDREGKYPTIDRNYWDTDLGAEGLKFIQPWEVPQYPGHVPTQPRRGTFSNRGGQSGGQASMALVESDISDTDTGGKRKREGHDEDLLEDMLSALHTARKAKR
ncbi:hypothetical protein F5Y00DRAFT_237758 [Daldinia vernicosa]|uniref:uncharacterized protein n=1 Tax=Daldinia vernicosa TaxID=114800 RepID=UPI0020087A3F|nr:uncharacterized protein F5Y00DRAFT_237758 [Daldinia vernicosa]KAI0848557.1 hypothetical protein F5Y00DRAFT_237758 [Daldinia vernicosa]